jgi:hypothetical protein
MTVEPTVTADRVRKLEQEVAALKQQILWLTEIVELLAKGET